VSFFIVVVTEIVVIGLLTWYQVMVASQRTDVPWDLKESLTFSSVRGKKYTDLKSQGGRTITSD